MRIRATIRALAGLAASGVMAASGATALADGDAAAGERVFRQCLVCHSLAEGQNGVGPSFYGLYGRTAGTVEGYNYTPAMAESGVVWNAENLDAHLSDVAGFIPGNRMALVNPQGIPDAQQRADLIEYLKQATSGPGN